MCSGDSGDDFLKDVIDGIVWKDGERLIDEVCKDLEQLFKFIGEVYVVFFDLVKWLCYDFEEDLRKFRIWLNDFLKNVYIDRKYFWINDGFDV